MFLLIFESIGTSELILVGIIALIFLGPRKLPEMARKIGKITAEFRGTANEFKETWQREVNFEEEANAFDLRELDAEPVPRVSAIDESGVPVSPPSVRPVDPAEIEQLDPKSAGLRDPDASGPSTAPSPDDKKNWL